MTAPKLTIISEGESDTRLIRKLIAHELTSDMKFYASQGRLSLLSLARNLIVHEGGPVLLVMDADSTNPHVRRELEAMTIAAISGAGGDGTLLPNQRLFNVFMFVPEIEVVFFEAPRVLERIMNKPVDTDTVELGLTEPKKVLVKLTGDSKALAVDLLSRKIDEEGIEILRAGKQARALRQTVNDFLRGAVGEGIADMQGSS